MKAGNGLFLRRVLLGTVFLVLVGLFGPLAVVQAGAPAGYQDNLGGYLFPGVPAGSYTVVVLPSTVPNGLRATFDEDGGTISPDNQTPVGVQVDDEHLTADFGYGPQPTAVILGSLAATVRDGNIVLSWETASELDMLGFHLFRAESPDGVQSQLNGKAISSQAPGNPTGAYYEFLDESARAGVPYYYWLEIVNVNGDVSRYGPVSATIEAQATTLYTVFLPTVSR